MWTLSWRPLPKRWIRDRAGLAVLDAVRTRGARVEGEQHAAQYYLAVASNQGGDYRSTDEICRALIRSLPGDQIRERFGLVVPPALMARTALAHALADRDTFDEGDAHGQEAIRIAEALDHPRSILWGCIELAYLKSVRGELGQAIPLLERALAQSREWNITSHTPIALACLGHVSALAGRSAEGVSWLEEAVTGYDSAGMGVHHSLCVEWLGEACLLADRVEDARAAAERALTLARERGEHACQAWTLRLLGDIAARGARPDVATAAGHYDAAMTLASTLDMRPLVAHCHRGRGGLYRRVGDPAQAQADLTTARAMYREMGMTHWMEALETG
jgi:tetratricopeptide (TPR) repeat protein